MTQSSLSGKNVLLTGGTGILGSAFSNALAGAGATLVICDLDDDACKARAAELSEKHKAKISGVAVDITDEDAIANLAVELTRDGLAPDILINSAAAKSPNFFAPLGEFPLADWEQVMRVNVTGMFLMIRAFLPGMVERGGGNIINVASIYGIVGPDQRIYDGSYYADMGGAINTPLVYSASKGAVIAITNYISSSFGADNIRCNTLVPGGVFSGQNDTFVEKYSGRVPLGRMADKSEIATALLFLASEASSYVNGQRLIVDGGLTAW